MKKKVQQKKKVYGINASMCAYYEIEAKSEDEALSIFAAKHDITTAISTDGLQVDNIEEVK